MVRRMLMYSGEDIQGNGESLTPRLLGNSIPLRFVKLASGPKHLALLTANGDVYTTGVGNMGQLGRELDEKEENIKYLLTGSVKRRLYGFGKVIFPKENIKIVQISCSTLTSAALSEVGELFIWGFFNQRLIDKPEKVEFGEEVVVKDIALGATHCIALVENPHTRERNIYTWGSSRLGGLGREIENESPMIVDFFSGKEPTKISASHDSSAVIADTTLYVFGDVEYATSKNICYQPREVIIQLEGETLIPDIVTLGVHSALVSSKGNLFGWGSGLVAIMNCVGYNGSAQFNSEQNNSLPLPLLFSFSSDVGSKIVSMSVCDEHFAFSTDKGNLFTWGMGSNGRLGNGSVKNHPLPTQVNFGHPVSSVALCLSSTYSLVIPPIFRVPLEQIMQFEVGDVPSIIDHSLNFLSLPENCRSEGLFRLSGSAQIIKDLTKLYDFDCKVEMSGYAVDDVAGLFKHFLRQLPVPLIPLDIQSRLRDAMQEQIMPIRYNSFYRIIHEMPAHHYLLLKKILPFLQLVVSNSEKNKMTLKNLIMCMLPPIFGQEMMNDMQIASINGTVLSLLVHNTDLWFGKWEEMVPVQLNRALDENLYLHELSSLLMNLISVIDPAKLQELFVSSGVADKVIGKVLNNQELKEEDWIKLSDILLFILPLTTDCDSIIIQLKILKKNRSKIGFNVNTKNAIGNIFGFYCYFNTGNRVTDDRKEVSDFIKDLLSPK